MQRIPGHVTPKSKLIFDKQMMVYVRKLYKTKGAQHAIEWMFSRVENNDELVEILDNEIDIANKIMNAAYTTDSKHDLQVLNLELYSGVSALHTKKINKPKTFVGFNKELVIDNKKDLRKLLKRESDKQFYEKVMLERSISEFKPLIREYIRRKAIKYQHDFQSSETASEASLDHELLYVDSDSKLPDTP